MHEFLECKIWLAEFPGAQRMCCSSSDRFFTWAQLLIFEGIQSALRILPIGPIPFKIATPNCSVENDFVAFQVEIPASNTFLHNITSLAYTGLNSTTLESNILEHYGIDYTAKGQLVTFATVFGVLFSGVTGIMAGANLSGEFYSLKCLQLTEVLFTCFLRRIETSRQIHTQRNFIRYRIYFSYLPVDVSVGCRN